MFHFTHLWARPHLQRPLLPHPPHQTRQTLFIMPTPWITSLPLSLPRHCLCSPPHLFWAEFWLPGHSLKPPVPFPPIYLLFFFSFSINLSSKLLSYNSHYVTLLQSSPYKNILSSFGAYHALGYSYLTTWLLQSLNIYKNTLIHVYHTSEHLSSRSILLPPPSLPFKTHAHLTASHLSFRTQLKHKLLQEACFSTRPPQRHTTPARSVSFILWLHLFCCATRCKFTSLFPQLDNELSEGKLCLIHPSILVPSLSLAQCF